MATIAPTTTSDLPSGDFPFGSLILGTSVMVSSLLFFGFAVHRGWVSDLAPRIANRPKKVLTNAMLHHLPTWMKSSPMWYPIAWIAWAYHLSYKECLKGIPGTGTRKDGTEGTLLKTKLDIVIMLRFHTFLFKVGVLVAILCTFVILPINYTAVCDVEQFGNGTCSDIQDDRSLFARTSISNVPARVYNPTNQSADIAFKPGIIFEYLGGNTNSSTDLLSSNSTVTESIDLEIEIIRNVWIPNQTLRVLALLFSCVLIYVYTMYLLYWEWVENVALRRKYFLEATIYSQRMGELNKLALEKIENDNLLLMLDKSVIDDTVKSNKVQMAILRRRHNYENSDRPEYLTHPEITETPPSVGIFSVLYQLPRSMVTFDTDGATPLERQLVATTNFFDEIVRPEPGFSSSVAAVTILPNAKLLSRARNKWEICEKKLQKLRYVRQQLYLSTKRQEEYERKDWERQKQLYLSQAVATTIRREEEESATPEGKIQIKPNIKEGKILTQTDTGKGSTKYDSKNSPNSGSNNNIYNGNTVGMRINPDESIDLISSCEKSKSSCEGEPPPQKLELKAPDMIEVATNSTPPSPLRPCASAKYSLASQAEVTASFNVKASDQNADVFRYADFDVKEYATSIGFFEEVHDTVDFLTNMDIEEFNVFAYKCAVLAGSNSGLDKRMFNQYGIETLREEEIRLLEELREATQQLLQAREDVAMTADKSELKDYKPPIQPSIPIDDEDSTIERYSDFEVAGHLSNGIRQRKVSGISNNKSNVSEASPNNRGTNEEIAARENTTTKPKLSTIRRILGFLECFRRFPRRIYRGRDGIGDMRELRKYYGSKDPSDTETGRSMGFLTNLDHPSYAVVTFTTRHEAIVARQCLADGSALNHWTQVDDIPLYPLADAPPWEVGRPVTPTIPYGSKKSRTWIVYIVLMVFTIANVWVVNKINSIILQPKAFRKAFNMTLEKAESWCSSASGLTQSLLFSISPKIVQVLANIEGSATSEGKSEQKALVYFWYFFIIARFMGQIVWDVAFDIYRGTGTLEGAINEGITELAQTVPTTLGPLAMTYIIFAATVTWPAIYFLQLPNLATSFLRLFYINRLLKSGGPGTEVDYRVYVDSGYIFACMTALAPLCPLLGPVCLLYFIVVVPMLRWLLVFGYRPRFEGGGDKWPNLHHIILTSLILGQVITAITLVLKQNIYEGFAIALCIIPTLIYNSIILEQFLRPYQDAALLQTSRMYSHSGDSSVNTNSWRQREEYRRWLVDCHKASYLPTCLSGGTNNILTSEPAMVISEGMASILETADTQDSLNEKEENCQIRKKNRESIRTVLKRQKGQKGGILHRQQFNI